MSWLFFVLLALLIPASTCNSMVVEPRGSFLSSLYSFFKFTMNMLLSPLTGTARTPDPEISTRVSYKNFQLLRVRPRTETQLNQLESLEEEADVKFWSWPFKNRSSNILVPPDVADDVKEFLDENNIEFSVISTDIQKWLPSNQQPNIFIRRNYRCLMKWRPLLQEMRMKNKSIADQNPKLNKGHRAELKVTRGHMMTWNRYHRYQDMLDYLEHLLNAYPHLVELFTIGKSSQGRSLKVVKVSTSMNKEDGFKPAIWIDGGTHGREWISPAVTLYILKQLVENYKSYKHLVDGLDWYIMPVINPDGYEYSHTTDRFWRKSRSLQSQSLERKSRFLWFSSSNCRGVDLNRNWDFHWGETGASDDPCRETYAGSRAFSEPETTAVSDFIMDHRDRLQVYLTLHSYSQMWLIPWGYTKYRVRDYDDLMFMGRKAVDALQKVHGTKYEVGTSPSLLYPTSGSSDDWAKGKAGIKYSYTVELRDKGNHGFLLPASQITPTGREMFAAVRAIARTLLRKRQYSPPPS